MTEKQTAKQRQARFKQRKKQAGLVRMELWVRPELRVELVELVDALNRKFMLQQNNEELDNDY